MPTRRDVDALAKALNALSARAKADLGRLWPSLPTDNLTALRKALEGVWPELIASYGELASVVGADVFEAWAADLGVTPRTVVVDPVDPDRANARMRWAIGQPLALGALGVILDELVKQPGRSTLRRSAGESSLRVARVPRGDTCAFCLMLASRGAVYAPEASAGKFRKFHGDCDCSIVPVRGPQDYPDGYDPGELYDAYVTARSNASSDSTSAILAALRDQEGIH